jgi:hypothetical protein
VKSESALAAKRSGMSLALPNPTPFWPGIGDCSPRSLTAPNTGSIQGVLRFHQKLKPLVCMARENSGWGYDRIVGAIANLGHRLSDQTVKNILRRHGIAPVPNEAKSHPGKTSSQFI